MGGSIKNRPFSNIFLPISISLCSLLFLASLRYYFIVRLSFGAHLFTLFASDQKRGGL